MTNPLVPSPVNAPSQNPRPPDPLEGMVPECELEDVNAAEIQKIPSFRDIVEREGRINERLSTFEEIGVGDVSIERIGENLSFKLNDQARELLERPWKQAVVAKLLGRSIGYTALRSRIQSLWRPMGKLQIIDLENDYYLVKCELKEDYDRALLNGPWVIMGHYLTIQAWSQEFRTAQPICSKVAVWVRLPALPVQYYNETLLTLIGNQLGSTLKIDMNTMTTLRGRFARMAVEIDIAKPLTASFCIDGEVQRIEYESLPSVCFQCGRVGHGVESCEERSNQARNHQGGRDEDVYMGSELGPNQENEGEGAVKFGPWIHVQKRNRRQNNAKKWGKEVKAGEGSEAHQEESRYGILKELQEDPALDQHTVAINKGKASTGSQGKQWVWREGSTRKEANGYNDKGGKLVPRRDKERRNEPSRKDKIVDLTSREVVMVEENSSRGGHITEQAFPSLNFGAQLGQCGSKDSIGKDEGEMSGMEVKNFAGESHFNWGYPKKPPFPARKLRNKGRPLLDSSGKRVLPQSVEELVSKSARPRHEEEPTDEMIEEEETVSLVESTFQEGPDEGER